MGWPRWRRSLNQLGTASRACGASHLPARNTTLGRRSCFERPSRGCERAGIRDRRRCCGWEGGKGWVYGMSSGLVAKRLVESRSLCVVVSRRRSQQAGSRRPVEHVTGEVAEQLLKGTRRARMWGLPAVNQSFSQASVRTEGAREKEPSCVVSGPSVVAAVIAVGLAPLLLLLLLLLLSLSHIYTHTHSRARANRAEPVRCAHACSLSGSLLPRPPGCLPPAASTLARCCHAIRRACPALPCPALFPPIPPPACRLG